MKHKSKRRIVREKVMQVLFANEMNKDSLQLQINEILSDIEAGSDRDFANDLIKNVLEHVEDFDSMIKTRVANWEMNRIALIDRILFRMGICELLCFSDIPPKVSINEAIEISKEYSTAGSAKFINGILDAILS
ncbi:MAG: transcription antitermination factor NusB, partial [Ignavibacteriaceae bacterium]